MTNLYFVRHAQPIHSWEENRTRPLTEEGVNDSKEVTRFFKDIQVDAFISSPYKRSMDTIAEAALQQGMEILTYEGLKERKAGKGSNTIEMMRKRWENFDYCEDGGESIGSVQKRNMEALTHILHKYEGKTVVIGTHGTALSTILNNYDKTYNCDSFLRIIDFMPYIIKLTFDGVNLIGKEELLIIKKDYV